MLRVFVREAPLARVLLPVGFDSIECKSCENYMYTLHVKGVD